LQHTLLLCLCAFRGAHSYPQNQTLRLARGPSVCPGKIGLPLHFCIETSM